MEKWKEEFDEKYGNITFTPSSEHEAFLQIAPDVKAFIEKVRQEAIMEVINEIPDGEIDEFTGDSVTLLPLKDQLKTKFNVD